MMPPTKVQRLLGGLLGVHAGDALGATLEFSTWHHIRTKYPDGLRTIVGGGPFGWPAGHATDDTDLTRAVLLAYRARADGSAAGDVAKIAGDRMVDWLEGRWPDRSLGQGPVDMGAATGIGLQRYRSTRDPMRAGAGEGQAGNGSLMRCIATGLFQPDRASMIHESIRISAITHDDRRCVVACAAYNGIVRALLGGAIPGDAVREGLAVAAELEEDAAGLVQEAIRVGIDGVKVAELAETGPGPLKGKASGYVLESLTLAVSAVLDPRSFVDVLVDVVRVGRDTDTNGAIAGGLLGVRDGIEAIPKDWIDTLQFADEFTEVVTAMVADE